MYDQCENCHSEDVQQVAMFPIDKETEAPNFCADPIMGYYCHDCTVFVPESQIS